MKLVFATANLDKVEEIQEILADFEILARPAGIAEIDETGSTLLENARIKAIAIRDATGMSAISDDTGLEVEALGGAPGVYSARYAGPLATYADNVEKLLGALNDQSNRQARFRSVAFVAFEDGEELWAEGTIEGMIATTARGQNGFGYDPIFIPKGSSGQTFAEMTSAEKHAVSHRGLAFRALAEKLSNKFD